MNKVFKIAAGLVLAAEMVSAQEIPQFSQYYQNLMLVNPAVVGAESYWDMRVGYRQQWAGVEQSPETVYLTAQGNLNAFKSDGLGLRTSQGLGGKNKALLNHGLGLTVMNDQFGMIQQTGALVSYAQHYKLTRKMNFSAGLSVGMSNVKMNANDLTVLNQSDQTYTNFMANNSGTGFLDGAFGVMLYSENFFAGYSVNHLFGNSITLNGEQLNDYYNLHHLFTGGYRIAATKDWDFIPSVLVKVMDKAPSSFDISMRAKYKNSIWLGTSYRRQESISMAFGFLISNTLNVSYSYDFNTSKFRRYSNGSHEIILGLNLFKENKKLNRYLW